MAELPPPTSAGHRESASDAVSEKPSTASTAANSTEVDPVLQCTALSQMTPLLPNMYSSSSESEADEPELNIKNRTGFDAVSSSRATSCKPICVICLGRCRDKCFTDSCKHQSCFECLREWSKVKPECPLCKTTFRSIIHNIKSKHKFEEYHVQPSTVLIPQRPNTNFAQNRVERLDETQASSEINLRNRLEIALQLKRMADIRSEKLRFEIARFKYQHPGFHFSPLL